MLLPPHWAGGRALLRRTSVSLPSPVSLFCRSRFLFTAWSSVIPSEGLSQHASFSCQPGIWATYALNLGLTPMILFPLYFQVLSQLWVLLLLSLVDKTAVLPLTISPLTPFSAAVATWIEQHPWQRSYKLAILTTSSCFGMSSSVSNDGITYFVQFWSLASTTELQNHFTFHHFQGQTLPPSFNGKWTTIAAIAWEGHVTRNLKAHSWESEPYPRKLPRLLEVPV